MQIPLAIFLHIHPCTIRSADFVAEPSTYTGTKCFGLMTYFLSDHSFDLSGTWFYGFSGEKGLERLPRTSRTTASSTSPRAASRAAV